MNLRDAAFLLMEAYRAGRFDAAWRLAVPLLESSNPKGGQFKKGGGRETGGTQAAKGKPSQSKQAKAAAAKKTKSKDKVPPGGTGGGGGEPGGGGSAASDGGEGHQKRLKETRKKLNNALAAAHISSERRREFKESVTAVVERMTPAALNRLHNNVKDYAFYETHETLTMAVHLKYPNWTKPIDLAGAFDEDGEVHLGPAGFLGDRITTIQETHAHEMSHGIDGVHKICSGSKEWKEAWREEIVDTGHLGAYATTSPSEGFAVFGSRLLGDGGEAQGIQVNLPKCFKFWKDRGLV